MPVNASTATSPDAPGAETLTQLRRALGRQLAAMRNRAGLSQWELAPLTGYSRSTLSDAELAARAVEEERRATACAELLAVGGRLADARLSSPAMTVLLELLANAAAGGRASLPDHPVTVWMAPTEGTLTIRSDLGSLAIEGRSVVIGSGATEPVEGRDEEAM